MKRREFIKGAAALAAYSQLEKAEALTSQQRSVFLGGTAWQPEASALFARATSSLTQAEKTAINTRILRYKACGAWSLLDALYGFKTQGVASLNWKSTSYGITPIGSISYSSNQGYQNAGGYLKTGFIPSAGGTNYVQNSALHGVWVKNPASGVTRFHMGANDLTSFANLQTSVANAFLTYVNQASGAGGISVAGVATTTGQYIGQRTASGAFQASLNGTSRSTGSQASNGLPAVEFYIGARNSVGTAAGNTNDLYQAGYIGAALTDDQIASIYAADLEYVTDIVAPGDSLTAGSGASSASMAYPPVAGGLFSPVRNVSNQGIGGQTSTQIAARMGAQPITVTVTSNQIPASGGVSVTAKNINPLYNSGSFTGSMAGYLAGIHGNMTTDGSGNWTFTRFTAGSATSCPAGSQFTPDLLAAFQTKTAWIWAGNNGADGGFTVTGDVAAMVATYSRALILSILNSQTEPSGSGGYTTKMANNASFSSSYGSRYSDVRAALIANADAGNPVDVLNVSQDVPPFSMRSVNVSGTITTATVNPGDTSFTVSVSGLGAGYILHVGTEYIYINSASGTSVTNCTRGYAGTAAGTYASGQAFAGTDPIHLSDAGYAIVAAQVEADTLALGW